MGIDIAYQEKYIEIAKKLTLTADPKFIERCREALADGDYGMYRINVLQWHVRAVFVEDLSKEIVAAGYDDNWMNRVSVFKEAVRLHIENGTTLADRPEKDMQLENCLYELHDVVSALKKEKLELINRLVKLEDAVFGDDK